MYNLFQLCSLDMPETEMLKRNIKDAYQKINYQLLRKYNHFTAKKYLFI